MQRSRKPENRSPYIRGPNRELTTKTEPKEHSPYNRSSIQELAARADPEDCSPHTPWTEFGTRFEDGAGRPFTAYPVNRLWNSLRGQRRRTVHRTFCGPIQELAARTEPERRSPHIEDSGIAAKTEPEDHSPPPVDRFRNSLRGRSRKTVYCTSREPTLILIPTRISTLSSCHSRLILIPTRTPTRISAMNLYHLKKMTRTALALTRRIDHLKKITKTALTQTRRNNLRQKMWYMMLKNFSRT